MGEIRTPAFQVTDETIHKYGSDVVKVQYADPEDGSGRTHWRLIVNDDASHWTRHYSGLLKHKSYVYATDYWAGTLPTERPFRILESLLVEAHSVEKSVLQQAEPDYNVLTGVWNDNDQR